MNKLFGVALAIFLGLGMMFFFLARQRSGELDEPSVDQSAERARDAEAQMMEVENELEETRARVATLETELEEANAAIAEADAAAAAPEEVDEEEVAEEETEKDVPDLDVYRERLRTNPQARVQVQAVAEMTYADFLSSVELDAEMKAALKELYTDSQREQTALIVYAMQLGDVKYSELSEWSNAERDRLNSEAANLLSSEDYDAWAGYQDDIEAHELETNLGRQIQMFSSGLTPENLDMITQVAVDEFLIEQRALMSSDLIVSQREGALWQIRAMEAMVDRLVPIMEESQYQEYSSGFYEMAMGIMDQIVSATEEE